MDPASAIPTGDDEQQLALRARAGCTSSFEALVRRMQSPLLGFLIRQLHHRADAEDVLQESFVRAYVNLSSFNPKWRFKTWLFAIARNLAVSHRRAMRVVSSNIESTSPSDLPHEDDAYAKLTDAEASDSLWRIARATLSDEQVAALWLFYVEEMSAPEIAKVLGRSWVSVKTMLHRARRRLQKTVVAEATTPPKAPARRGHFSDHGNFVRHNDDEVTHDRPIPLDR